MSTAALKSQSYDRRHSAPDANIQAMLRQAEAQDGSLSDDDFSTEDGQGNSSFESEVPTIASAVRQLRNAKASRRAVSKAPPRVIQSCIPTMSRRTPFGNVPMAFA